MMAQYGEREPGDDERVLAGRQAAQHAKVADSHDGRRSGPRPERVAGLRNDIELIADVQEAVAEDVLRRAAVDADRDPKDAFADARQGAGEPLPYPISACDLPVGTRRSVQGRDSAAEPDPNPRSSR